MSTPGRASSEHFRAARAEAAAYANQAAGLVLVVLGLVYGQWIPVAVGAVLVAAGAALLASIVRSYCDSRGTAKQPRPYLPPVGKL